MSTRAGVLNPRVRRGVVRASVTRLETKIPGWESKEKLTEKDQQSIARTLKRLQELSEEFMRYHYSIVERMDDAEVLAEEQDVLDEFDDKLENIMDRLNTLKTVPDTMVPPPTTIETEHREVVGGSIKNQKRLRYMRSNIDKASSAVRVLEPTDDLDVCLVEKLKQDVNILTRKLADIVEDILSLPEDDTTSLDEAASMENELGNLTLKLIKLTYKREDRERHTMEKVSTGFGVRLPKISVPTFNGNILEWKKFWEQFQVSIHTKDSLSDAEKLAYLNDALKGGPATHVVEGLAHTAETYHEAIKCLQERYDRPRLIHRAHVKSMLEAPPMKGISGQEIRRIHDVLNQHMRALKADRQDTFDTILTAAMEDKLDHRLKLKWMEYSDGYKLTPPCTELVKFLDIQAQHSENLFQSSPRQQLTFDQKKRIKVSNAATSEDCCVVCKKPHHHLRTCKSFQQLEHEKKVKVVRENGLCMNCLGRGHIAKKCTMMNMCTKCNGHHHTLLHLQEKEASTPSLKASSESTNMCTHTSIKNTPSIVLLMTCQVNVIGPDGRTTKARALLDPGSCSSFVSEHLVQHLRLPRRSSAKRIIGIGGISCESTRGTTQFSVTRIKEGGIVLPLEATVLKKITADLPCTRVKYNTQWKHLSRISLADPDFGNPAKIDLILGADISDKIMRHGRRTGSSGSPIALRTIFGWVLMGPIPITGSPRETEACCVSSVSLDEELKRFWEVEECNFKEPVRSVEEKAVIKHFEATHYRDELGRFVVTLPKRSDGGCLGESRSVAVKRFFSLERSLRAKGQYEEFTKAVKEYFDMDHAELVPRSCMNKPASSIYYMPMHTVLKSDRTTTKLRVVFDASAKSSSGVSLNDQLMVGPTVHAQMIDVLLRFRRHRIALATDVSKMYRAVILHESQRDLHRFVWRSESTKEVIDCRMSRLTFGVAASPFAANMAVRRNAKDLEAEYPQAAKAVLESFYVDDGLVGADTVEEAKKIRTQLQELFGRGGFILRKWKSSAEAALEDIPMDLRDNVAKEITEDGRFTMILGVEWSSTLDAFRPRISRLESDRALTKRILCSEIAKIYDVLGWWSPATIKMKILLQRLWEYGIDWDETLPVEILNEWKKWSEELPCLCDILIPRYYLPTTFKANDIQLHGFCDASENAYAAVVYIRGEGHKQSHLALVAAKTKVAPIKRQTIPRLELCGALILARLLYHCANILEVSIDHCWAWTDSMIVLSWLHGNPRRLKTFVGNRVAEAIELIPPNRWNHVQGTDNPADCASRGVYPSELRNNNVWWQGPQWLLEDQKRWQMKPTIIDAPVSLEEYLEDPTPGMVTSLEPSLCDKISSFTRLKRVTAWMLRFVHNSRNVDNKISSSLSTKEIQRAEQIWIRRSQSDCFTPEITKLKENKVFGKFLPYRPFFDEYGIVRVGGRTSRADLPSSVRHPIILHGKHRLTRLIIEAEHLRMLHAGITSTAYSLQRTYCILKGRSVVRGIVRSCVTCRKIGARPNMQLMGQLPKDRVNPGSVFETVGVDYAGPITVKSGAIRKPVIRKAYVALFVSLSVKAVHIEVVSDLTTAAFIATLRRFTARRGKPAKIWSDHGTNFIGAERELDDLYAFLRQKQPREAIIDHCSSQNIQWSFIPEHAPHFGGLWEAAVKSFKHHFRRVVGEVRLTFEELTTITSQIEACMNSRPLTPLIDDTEGYEALTPGHFIIGRPMEALPDEHQEISQPINLLRRWQLCQAVVNHFWKRWSKEYIIQLGRFNKWKVPTPNIKEGDIVCVRKEPTTPTKWPLARVIQVHPGHDGKVRVVTIQTCKGVYKRPVVNLVPLVHQE